MNMKMTIANPSQASREGCKPAAFAMNTISIIAARKGMREVRSSWGTIGPLKAHASVSLFAGISIVQRTPSARNLRSTLPPNSWARRSRITLLP